MRSDLSLVQREEEMQNIWLLLGKSQYYLPFLQSVRLSQTNHFHAESGTFPRTPSLSIYLGKQSDSITLSCQRDYWCPSYSPRDTAGFKHLAARQSLVTSSQRRFDRNSSPANDCRDFPRSSSVHRLLPPPSHPTEYNFTSQLRHCFHLSHSPQPYIFSSSTLDPSTFLSLPSSSNIQPHSFNTRLSPFHVRL